MRKQTSVLLFLFVLTLALWVEHRPLPFPPRPVQPDPETPQAPSAKLPAYAPFFTQQNLSVPEELETNEAPSAYRQSFYRALEKRAGSYTNFGDLLKGSQTPQAELRSDWLTPYLFPDRTLPSLRVRIIQNPETGEYEFSGGSLSIPNTFLEAGYETELNSEEYKATIQLKKSF